MPALVPTDWTARIVWLGRVLHRDRKEIDAEPLDVMPLDFGGLAAEHHSGVTRASCSRVVAQHPRGTEIANVRQLSIVSVEELDEIAREIGLDGLDPAWLGASIALEGLPDLTHVPPSSRLQGPDGLTLVVDMANQPCQFPAMTIVEALGPAGRGFKAAAEGRRGVTAWVERPGTLRGGERLRLHIPGQRAWSHERKVTHR